MNVKVINPPLGGVPIDQICVGDSFIYLANPLLVYTMGPDGFIRPVGYACNVLKPNGFSSLYHKVNITDITVEVLK